MKCSRKLAASACSLVVVLALRAELPHWVRSIESGDRLESVFFGAMPLPGGPVSVRRPPKETRVALSQLIAASPAQAGLHALRAREDELLLDLPSAESGWKKYAELAGDKFEGHRALADYYYRQLRVTDELLALSTAALQPSPPAERFTPAAQQRSWQLFERMLARSQRHLLSFDTSDGLYKQWTARYPNEASPFQQWARFAIASKQYSRAGALIEDYSKRFSIDRIFPVTARADLEKSRSGAEQALAIYDRAFDPLWPQPLVESHFKLLRETRTLRRFLTNARSAASSNPLALDPVARQFHFYRQEGQPGAAQRVLLEFRQRKESRGGAWTPEELRTLAALWRNEARDANEAARCYYALYSLPGAAAAHQEEALAGLISLLLDTPQPRLALGAGDLSFYKDIAAADALPGFLNGILSLLLNASEPASRFASQEQAAVPYFQRVRAAELLELFERRFPQSQQRAPLRSRLIEAFAIHGDSDAVLAAGSRFLSDFPAHSSRMQVSLLMADAHARKSHTKEELAIYDALLATYASGVGDPSVRRSPEYARVLDRYISRLAALRRLEDALRVLRREIDRNPDDPALYERLATFLDQNKLAAEIEAVYRRAIERFPDRSWHHKLARHYLRQKQNSAFQQLTAEVAKIFTGTELERYFGEIVASAPLDAVLYRQVNLYANQRFPHNLTFVRNLLSAYERRGTADPAAWERLIRQHWFYDDVLRARFFEFLSRSGKFRAETQALLAQNTANAAANPAGARMLAEAECWRSHFEEAAPVLSRLAKDAPGDIDLGRRTASLHRSLAKLADAEAFELTLSKAAPRDSTAIIRAGEIRADREEIGPARAHWRRIPQIEPGSRDGYLETATVFWDYFQYDDALRTIEEGRKRLNQPSLFAYEAGAIHENKRRYDKAIEEYVNGSLAQPGGSSSQSRLLLLARRPALRGVIDAVTSRLVAQPNPSLEALALRIALLEAQERKEDLEATLVSLIPQAQSFDLLARLEEEGRRLALPDVEERSLARQIELTPDAVDKLRMRLQLARFHEGRRNFPAAARTIDALYRENPTRLGIVRAAVDYHWRNKNTTRAIELLSAAAGAAHVSFKPHFEFEAARKATEAGDARTARQLLAGLLGAQPYNAAYLGAMADTFVREGDDANLRAFYQEKIAALGKAPFAPQERQERIAAMRRALIPVLTRARDQAAAIDQYLEILSRYPEDAGLVEEAASYARVHQQQRRVLAYCEKAAADSPRDFRWPLLLARLDTSFENYPAAIDQYTRAAAIRPDRADLLAARGNLEERLLRFDEAAATFTKVYDLTYRNSVWMERVAEIRARQGRTDDAVQALRQAFLEGRNDSPQAHFDVAQRLEAWDAPDRAREFAERGVTLAGSKLFQEHPGGAQIYARVMTRLKEYEAAHARAPRGELLAAIAQVVRTHYNAGEKNQFAAFLERVKSVALPEIGRIAGLAAWEAQRRHEIMMAAPGGPAANQQIEPLKQLQRRRLAYSDLGPQLEAYANAHDDPSQRLMLLAMAAEAFQSGGDENAELRIRAILNAPDPRYLDLLARRRPDALIRLAERGMPNEAVNAAVSSGNPGLALKAITARGRNQAPVWTRSYTGLAGLYFALATPEIENAFRRALGDAVIGNCVGRPADRREQLAGSVWYYYGARFGEYLDMAKKPGGEDYLPAIVEATPGRAESYHALAEYYRETGRPQDAIADYERALQIDPTHAASLDRIARVLASQGKREEARLRWRQALDALAVKLDERRVAPSVSGDLRDLLEQLRANELLTVMRPDVERVVAAYVKRFGAFQTEPLLRLLDPAWVIALSRQMRDPVDLLTPLLDAEWFPDAQRELLYERILEALSAQAATALGDARPMALANYSSWQGRWLQYLLDRKQADRARAAIASMSEEQRLRLAFLIPQLEMRMAAQTGRLGDLLAQYRAEPARVPSPYDLRQSAMTMREKGDSASARQLLRFSYEREIDRGDLSASNFLGLAEVLLEGGETDAALRQLRRMALVTQPAFAYLKDAGLLLRKYKKDSEALPFLEQAVKATPWDASAKAALAAPPAPAPQRTLAQLEAGVRDHPEDDHLKFELFRAARAANRHLMAANAVEALLPAHISHMFFRREGDAGEWQPNRYWAEQFFAGSGMSDGQRATLARELADSLARTGRLSSAVIAASVAESIQPSSENAARIGSWKAELARQRANQLRRPVISEYLEQERPVRPMLAQGGAR
ncbi:MAG: tetratricopeptide repeat protein [Acidobacteria bacterium]|nr:tetratricopeptide repeat protein [Acidobacteriota bacterium]